jgi:hypothetical protein
MAPPAQLPQLPHGTRALLWMHLLSCHDYGAAIDTITTQVGRQIDSPTDASPASNDRPAAHLRCAGAQFVPQEPDERLTSAQYQGPLDETPLGQLLFAIGESAAQRKPLVPETARIKIQ